MTFLVYIHRKATGDNAGDVFYVGFASKESRAKDTRRYDQPKWMNFYKKYGRLVETVERFEVAEDAFALERYLILSYRACGVDLANITDGGEGVVGWEHSEETKLRMSESHKRVVHTEEWNRNSAIARTGAKRSDESRARMSAGQKTRIRTEEELQRLRTAAVGRVVSEETREKARQSALKRWARMPVAEI